MQAKTGNTPLHCAAFCGHLEVCWLLVEGGSSVVVKGYASRTALKQAEAAGKVAVAAYLRLQWEREVEAEQWAELLRR